MCRMNVTAHLHLLRSHSRSLSGMEVCWMQLVLAGPAIPFSWLLSRVHLKGFRGTGHHCITTQHCLKAQNIRRILTFTSVP